jgi:hypothetical protein
MSDRILASSASACNGFSEKIRDDFAARDLPTIADGQVRK